MTADPRPKPLRWLLFATVIALFLGTRTYVLYRLHIPWSDVPLYAEYARDYADAARAGQSFYEFHAQAVRTRLAAQSPALPPEAIHWREHIEYPPLAISWMRFATGLLGRSSSPESFCRSYRFSMALTDMACLIILLWLVRRIHGPEPPIRQAVRMSLFVLWGAILGHLLYDRLDLGNLRWKMRGQSTWPVLVKVLVRFPLGNPDTTKKTLLGFMEEVGKWLNQPEHQKYLARWHSV